MLAPVANRVDRFLCTYTYGEHVLDSKLRLRSLSLRQATLTSAVASEPNSNDSSAQSHTQSHRANQKHFFVHSIELQKYNQSNELTLSNNQTFKSYSVPLHILSREPKRQNEPLRASQVCSYDHIAPRVSRQSS